LSNRLATETSPYLLQHADNPVDWYAWSPEAFMSARERDVPVLLSIGYSACHWCHVMERESFADPETAALMNAAFVNVKVDREERPDVDHIYMTAVQSLTGQGGWPLTAFLTPDGQPFYGGTYFPPERRHGLPSFREVLRAAATAYRDRRDTVMDTAAELTGLIAKATRTGEGPAADGDWDPDSILEAAIGHLRRAYDPAHGGWGHAPKFPQPALMDLLLRWHHHSGDRSALDMVVHTLRRMAAGGIRDHLGGGFHRYSVDERWLVPHFEKMLYDNAQLVRSYTAAHQITGEHDLRSLAEETADYVLEDLRDPAGAFYCARDADSEGEEGRFYVWSEAEVDRLLHGDATLFKRVYDVSGPGNFEGLNILHLPHDLAAIARSEGMTEEELAVHLRKALDRLFRHRENRDPPLRDDKVLTGWSALMVRALAEAGAAFGRDDYVEAARRAAMFLLGPLRPEGELHHAYTDGRVKQSAFLQDVAALGNALLSLYEATLDAPILDDVRWCVSQVLDRYLDEEAGLLFDTPHDGEALIVRPRELSDGAVPSGNSLAAELLLRAGRLLGDEDCVRVTERIMRSLAGSMTRFPIGFGRMLSTLCLLNTSPVEIALIGTPGTDAFAALHRTALAPFLPERVLAGSSAATLGLPILVDRPTQPDGPVAYVCRRFTCSAPLSGPEELAAELQRVGGASDPA
jgi:uncharacterized protein YyaL (SSP411 family)